MCEVMKPLRIKLSLSLDLTVTHGDRTAGNTSVWDFTGLVWFWVFFLGGGLDCLVFLNN